MIGHTEALAQQDDNAMDIDEEIISVEILESLGVNTGDGTLLHKKFFRTDILPVITVPEQ